MAVVCTVAVYLWNPELWACPRHFEQMTCVSMPETTTNKYYRMVTWEDYVRFAGQCFDVQTVSEPVAVEDTTYMVFGFGIFPPDAGHHPAPGFLVNNVSHLYGLPL
jgi:hypothetical protein